MMGGTADKFMGCFHPRLVCLLLVLALHAAALLGLWRVRLMPTPAQVVPLFVNFIAPPEEKQAPAPQHPSEAKPKSRRQVAAPQPVRQHVVETAIPRPSDSVAQPSAPFQPEPMTAPVAVAADPTPAVQTQLPLGPVSLSSELSVTCPQRQAPIYPARSRRLGERGVVVLWVELNETGHVATARVQNSSGFDLLDEAALSAVRSWRCSPVTRHGQPVRVSALQPFRFVLQGD